MNLTAQKQLFKINLTAHIKFVMFFFENHLLARYAESKRYISFTNINVLNRSISILQFILEQFPLRI